MASTFFPGQTLAMQTYDDGQILVKYIRDTVATVPSTPGVWVLVEVLESGELYTAGELLRREVATLCAPSQRVDIPGIHG